MLKLTILIGTVTRLYGNLLSYLKSIIKMSLLSLDTKSFLCRIRIYEFVKKLLSAVKAVAVSSESCVALSVCTKVSMS